MTLKYFFTVAGLLLCICGLSACANLQGTKIWNQDKHFTMESNPDIKQRDIKIIGVYVFSEGGPIDASVKRYDAIDVLDAILGIVRSLSLDLSTFQIGISPKVFPGMVTVDNVLSPDTLNAGPSLELSVALEKEIKERGYLAKIIPDLGHNSEVRVADCLENAKKHGLDAALIVNYSGLSKWTQYRNMDTATSGRTTIITTNVDVYEGFLYLPNAVLFDVKTNEVLWKNLYYGLVQNAHTFNLSGEPLHTAATSALVPLGAETYIEAASKSAKNLFAPEYWPGSVQEFPRRESKTKNL